MMLEMFNSYLNFLFVNHVNRMATAILDFMNAMVKETGISIKPLTCNKSLKLDNINMIKMYRVHVAISGNRTHNLSGDGH
jgi:hypothetical protein